MFNDFDIDELKKQYPLPRGVVDVVYNRDEIASALDKSTPMIDRYRKGGMPVLTAGGSGKSYEFQLWDCWAWYHGMKAANVSLREQKIDQLSLLREALVGEDGSDDMLHLSPKQRSEEYEAARRYAETALAQGKLVRRSEMQMLLEGVFGIVRNRLLALPDIMERRVGLTPEQAETMEKVAKETISSLSEKLASSNLAVVIVEKKRATK